MGDDILWRLLLDYFKSKGIVINCVNSLTSSNILFYRSFDYKMADDQGGMIFLESTNV